MTSENLKVVAILKRNEQGILERVNSIALKKGEVTTQFFTDKGLIVIVGEIFPNDSKVFEKIIKEIEN